jgi:hypothetical protein
MIQRWIFKGKCFKGKMLYKQKVKRKMFKKENAIKAEGIIFLKTFSV